MKKVNENSDETNADTNKMNEKKLQTQLTGYFMHKLFFHPNFAILMSILSRNKKKLVLVTHDQQISSMGHPLYLCVKKSNRQC